MVSIDLRLMNLDLIDPEEIAADRGALEAEARVNLQPSELLERLEAGQPVVVELSMLPGRLPPDAPPWLLEGRGCIRAYSDDVVEPADAEPNKCAYHRGAAAASRSGASAVAAVTTWTGGATETVSEAVDIGVEP
ncbi:MAG: hypothetical protein QOJ56_5412 [Mycobacterium sp.]|nr:hypothetical protein [Mycobacterium sp.]